MGSVVSGLQRCVPSILASSCVSMAASCSPL